MVGSLRTGGGFRALGVALSVVAVWGLVACDAGDEDASGEDTFAGNTLSRYTLLSREGEADVWTIRDGWLIGSAQGQAVNARAIREDVSIADGRVAFETDHITNGGIHFRVQDPYNYYLLAVRDDDASYPSMNYRNFELYVFEAGSWTTLAEYDLDIPRGTRHTVAVEFVGDRISLFLDGSVVDDIRDATITDPGHIGLEHDDRLTPGEETHYDVWRWEAFEGVGGSPTS